MGEIGRAMTTEGAIRATVPGRGCGRSYAFMRQVMQSLEEGKEVYLVRKDKVERLCKDGKSR